MEATTRDALEGLVLGSIIWAILLFFFWFMVCGGHK
jgi:hypothetical protein